MIPALLRGKLSREQENMEDVLTSSVFGQLQHIPASLGLARWLNLAVTVVGPPESRVPSTIVAAEYTFWPWLSTPGSPGAEPDVVIQARDECERQHLIVVEAKYRSGKSSEEDPEVEHPADQLARQWHCIAAELPGGTTAHLVYLTADFGPPVDAILASGREFAGKCPSLAATRPFSCHWLSWRHLVPAFDKSQESALRELCQLARRLDLCFFSGVTALNPADGVDWRFERSVVGFEYPALESGFATWRFAS